MRLLQGLLASFADLFRVYSPYEGRTDADALRSDWEAVGDDLATAMRKWPEHPPKGDVP